MGLSLEKGLLSKQLQNASKVAGFTGKRTFEKQPMNYLLNKKGLTFREKKGLHHDNFKMLL